MTLTADPPRPAPPSTAPYGPPDEVESAYLKYLPAVYRRDATMRSLLLICESVLIPLERVIRTLPLYTEPAVTPEAFLPWLAHWVGVSLDSAWPIDRQRTLIAHAVEIYRWRGTRRGLKLHIQAYTGVEPLIQEYRPGLVLSRESGLGWTSQLLTTVREPFLFVVTVPLPDGHPAERRVLERIIEEDMPAHTSYQLEVVRSSVTAVQEPT
jgi:phage tail-like protein